MKTDGCTLTAQVKIGVISKELEILRDDQLFELNEADWCALMSALENPLAPNAELQQAWDDFHADGLE